MKNENISRLFEKFKASIAEGKDPYFDADEIEDLLDGISDEDAEEYLSPILDLGLKLHPENQSLLIKRVERECFNENYEAALKYADEIGYINDPDLHLARMECYCFMKQYFKVNTYLDSLEKDDNDDLKEIYESFASLLADNDFPVEGINLTTRGLKLFPDNRHLKESLLYFLHVTDKDKEAIVLANELIDNNPYSYKVWLLLGTIYTKLSEYEKAVEALDFALTCKEGDSEAKKMKAYCLMENESYDKAIEVYLEIIRETPDGSIQPLLANCYIATEQFEKAYTLLKSILEVYGDRNDPAILGGYLHSCAQLDLDNEVMEVVKLKAKRYPEVKEFTLMEMMFNKLFSHESDESNINREIDKIRIDCGEKKNVYESVLFIQGLTSFHSGNSKHAIKLFEALEQSNSEFPLLRLLLAKTYLETGNKEKFTKQVALIEKNDFIELFRYENSLNSINPNFKGRKHLQILSKRYLLKKENSN
nr:tetratricopeptide repeat protein [uncultured Macellibacteroides sp.]